MIKSLVEKLPDEAAALQLLEMFEKLLKKYARQLGTEDAYEDLRLFFFELITKLKGKDICSDNDGYIISYIAKSIKNQYILMSKQRNAYKIDTFSDISEEQMIYIEQLTAADDKMDISIYFPIHNKLTEREENILKLFFVNEYSIEEIAKYLNISRQAVNQSKIRALNKIRNAYLKMVL